MLSWFQLHISSANLQVNNQLISSKNTGGSELKKARDWLHHHVCSWPSGNKPVLYAKVHTG